MHKHLMTFYKEKKIWKFMWRISPWSQSLCSFSILFSYWIYLNFKKKKNVVYTALYRNIWLMGKYWDFFFNFISKGFENLRELLIYTTRWGVNLNKMSWIIFIYEKLFVIFKSSPQLHFEETAEKILNFHLYKRRQHFHFLSFFHFFFCVKEGKSLGTITDNSFIEDVT